MDLSLLAAKQKRIKDWNDFVAEGGVQDARLKSEVVSAIDRFKKVLVKCWEEQKISPEDEQMIRDCERKLEQLNEESRMTVVGKKAGAPARVI